MTDMKSEPTTTTTVAFTREELRERLDPIQFQVTQDKGTEKPYTNKYYKHYETGMYSCIVCDEDMFKSETKYESGSGWPSFYDVLDTGKIKLRADSSGVGGNLLRIVANPHLIRTEVSCKKCNSHLGHVFPDGPKPTGKRYCVNSSSLNFRAMTDHEIEEEQKKFNENNNNNNNNSDETDESQKEKQKKEILSFPATISGCGPDGFCSIKPRVKKSPKKELQWPPVKKSDVNKTEVEKEVDKKSEEETTSNEALKETTEKEWSPEKENLLETNL